MKNQQTPITIRNKHIIKRIELESICAISGDRYCSEF